jgi:hypothetical protein
MHDPGMLHGSLERFVRAILARLKAAIETEVTTPEKFFHRTLLLQD